MIDSRIANPEKGRGKPGEDKKGEILVVEDDRAAREMLAFLLSDMGYGVTVATNGQDALARLQEGKRPDLIIVDLMMPVMDGWEFRKRQLADPGLSSIPVIVTTAVSPNGKNSFDELTVLYKPIDLDTLFDAIDNALL